jgi:hypothetical protein
MLNVQLRKSRPRRISIGRNREILELARKQGISINSETILHAVELGMKSPYSESQLSQRVNELEERKKSLDSEFRRIALQRNILESRFVGLGNQIGRVCRDNRVLVFHLCARTPSKDRERRMRDELIKKYLVDLKPS